VFCDSCNQPHWYKVLLNTRRGWGTALRTKMLIFSMWEVVVGISSKDCNFQVTRIIGVTKKRSNLREMLEKWHFKNLGTLLVKKRVLQLIGKKCYIYSLYIRHVDKFICTFFKSLQWFFVYINYDVNSVTTNLTPMKLYGKKKVVTNIKVTSNNNNSNKHRYNI